LPALPTPELVATVPVNPDVLIWARTLRGLSPETAAQLLDITLAELRAYESGRKKPQVGFLRNMSAKYLINFTSLLMPEPLPIEDRPVDHRTHRGERPLSIDTLLAFEEVAEALDAFGDIADEAPKIVQKLNIGHASLEEDPEVVAARERKRFSIGVEDQRMFRSIDQARRRWRQQIEDRGVFTYMIPMPPSELSGFSMLRDDLAAICVNDRESTEGRKIFTLWHEYCHLLLRQTGISDENHTTRVERFCNRFAASFLIPRADLILAIGDVGAPRDFSDSDVKRLATRFRVSNSAAALRLQETGLASSGFYGRRTAPWDIPSEPKHLKQDSSPNAITLRVKRIGQLHVKTVLRAAKRRVINSFDASDLIGLQPSSIAKLQERFE
jgi:Zn-dependent peptidase ImmA (M78 family)